jgi:lipopolysaccharide transport system ATP-binding protein
MEPIISVRGLGKSYRIQTGERKPYRTLRDDIADFGKGLLKGQWGNSHSEEFWAIKDIDFDIYPGEVVGIIGRNGAGKSTLLKVLSRVVQPTMGEAVLKGRVASLLEVGTGFHPELTGRENIFMSGAVLGMKRTEIKDRFDEIVEFSEVEKFLDIPVKRYSSGMYVRLAFAVVAHLEPEILIIDEVLAVGDASFQKKCLGKMEDVAKQKGRTILFVSHNISVIQVLCERCLLLKAGQVFTDKSVSLAIQAYLNSETSSTSFKRTQIKTDVPSFISGNLKEIQNTSEESIQIEVNIISPSHNKASLDVRLSDDIGAPVGFGSLGTLSTLQMIELNPGENHILFKFSTNQLAIGSYSISLDLTLPDIKFYDRSENCLGFEIIRPPRSGYIRALSQSWRYGSIEIEIIRIDDI